MRARHPHQTRASSALTPGNGARPRRRGIAKYLLPVAIASWISLLYGFVSTPSLIVLGVVGPLALFGGLYLTIGMGRYAFESWWYAGGLAAGVLVLGGAAATLAPAAPGGLLVTTAAGWEVLERRQERLDRAIDTNDIPLARRLAGRGLGEVAPLDALGLPVIHRVENAEMLAALLEAGFDPDARDADGRTLLMKTRQPALVRTLLAHGADIQASDRDGWTAGDVHADGPVRGILESHAGGRPPGNGAGADWKARARSEWVIGSVDPAAAPGPSAVSLDPRPLSRGGLATATADIVNAQTDDRWLEVRATLNTAALFVGASHGGAIENAVQPQLTQTIRWPLLSLPARSRGRLALQIVALDDEDAGDLVVDWQVRDLPGRAERTMRIYERPGRLDREPAATGALLFYGIGLAIAAGLWFLIGRLRTRAAGARVRGIGLAGAVAGAVLCAGLFTALVWSMLEPTVRFEAAACTILDRRLQLRTPVDTTSTGIDGRPADSTGTPYAVPMAAVRIDRAPGPLIATGFAVGMTTRSVHELRWFPLGARVPCWVDPDVPSRFTLVRSPSASGVLGLAFVAALTLGLGAAARALRSSASAARAPSGPGRETTLRARSSRADAAPRDTGGRDSR